MCGISFVLDRRARREAVALLRRMHEPIVHRGPDGGGAVFIDRRARGEGLARRRRMQEPIVHRGPDGEGAVFIDPTGRAERVPNVETAPSAPPLAGLAFRRLKILDLTDAAAQPMASPDGQTWIAFNGEIYNFSELRDELAASGRRFRSSGDTEVVLAAWEA